MENDKYKILWDFTVQTDHGIYGRRPDVQEKRFLQVGEQRLCDQVQMIQKKDWLSKLQLKEI